MRLLLISLTVAVWMTVGAVFAPAEAAPTSPADSLSPAAYLEDFEAAWTFVRDNYAYPDRKKTDWDRVRTYFLPRLKAVRENGAFIALLEEMLEQLYDAHAHLGVNTASSPRLVPSGTDLWAEHQGGRAIITDVRAGSEAERAGVLPGMEVVSVNGRPIREAVRERLPVTLREADPAAEDWALRAVLAGRHDAPVRVEVRDGERRKVIEFRPGSSNRPSSPLTVKILGGNIGYVRLHDSLGNNDLVAAWDSALVTIRETRGLILDLRDTPSGGNTTTARGLMSRLISDARPYQRHDLPSEERQYGVLRLWVEYVAPRGPFTYERSVAVLVGHWTGSMGEGVAIGLDGMKRATVVGTRMAGLCGANYDTTLPHTGIAVRVPAERLYHVDGTPREAFVPPVLVDPMSPKSRGDFVGRDAANKDWAMEAALELLRKGEGIPPH